MLKKIEDSHVKQLLGAYQESNREIRLEIEQLFAKGHFTQQEMYRLERLKKLNKSIDKIIDKLTGKTNKILTAVQLKLFEESYVITAKEITKQVGLSIAMIPQKQVEAVLTNPFDKVGYINRNKLNGRRLKARLKTEVMKGIIKGTDYVKVAKNIEEQNKIGLSNAVRIARTEGHRAREDGSYKAMEKGKELGLNIKKKWLATNDKRTRDDHSALNGQVVGIDEYFSVGGHEALRPGSFGVAEEDVNCRCTLTTVFEKGDKNE